MKCQIYNNCPKVTGANGTNVTSTAIEPLLSQYLQTLFFLVNGHILGNALCICGVFTNIINLIVYSKMGFSETTNIKLFALACVDLMICVCTVVMDMLFLMQEQDMPLAFRRLMAETVVYFIILLYPCIGCGAIITAILSTERCLCIVMPLKVRELLTPRRTWYMVGSAVLYELTLICLMFGLTGPPYDGEHRLRVTINVCAFTAPSFICFFIVSVSTAFLIVRLRQNLSWRKSASSQSKESSSKELRACRFAVAICSMFIICFFPNVLAYMVMLIGDPFISMRNPYTGSLVRVCFTFTFLLQSTSSSLNILIYYSMSSNYRATFKALFKHDATSKS